MKNLQIKIILLLLTYMLSSQVFAARYTYEQINEQNVSAINSSGTMIGVSVSGIPFVWYRDKITKNYIEANKFELPFLDGVIRNDIHVEDINNELPDGSGATIVGWYVDEIGLPQSLIWNKVKNTSGIFEYKVKKLNPHILTAVPCTGTAETDYGIPECISKNDNTLIANALGCDDNRNWQPGNNILVDLNWSATIPDEAGNPIRNPVAPICTKSLPVCDFKLAKVKFIVESKQGEGATAEITQVETYRYIYRHDYLEQKCVAPAHVDLILNAFGCLDENFTKDPEAIPPNILQCDKASKTTGINNDGMISGTSYRKDNTERPIFWLKKEETDENDLPNYDSGDLGAQRKVAYQTLSNDTNKSTGQIEDEDVVSRTKSNLIIAEVKDETGSFSQRIVTQTDIDNGKADKSVIEVKRDDGLIEQTFKTNFKEGKTASIDKFRDAIIGYLKFNNEDTIAKSVYWPSVSFAGVVDPKQLLFPEQIDTQNGDCPNKIFKEFTDNVEVTSAAGGNIIGWYTNDLQQAKPIYWQIIPCKDRNNIASEEFEPINIVTFDDINLGKALDNNNAESIGTTDVYVTSPDNQIVTEPHAFFRTKPCGIQDLNELLISPTSDITLTEARHLSAGNSASPIISQAKINVTGETGVFVLYPETVYLDLSASIAADHNTLTVGDQHTLTVTVQNNGSPNNEETPDNYATCVKFEVKASVVTDGDVSNEKLGGLTFKGYAADNRVYCVTGPVSIVCAIEKLENDEFISVDIFTEPRALLADRRVRTSVIVGSTEREKLETEENNYHDITTEVEREGCFIATAAYGSYMATQVKALRQFRDEILLKSEIGKYLVEKYYDYSPPLADYISNNETLRQMARWGLTPLVYGVIYPIQTLILVISILAIMTILIYSRKRKLTI